MSRLLSSRLLGIGMIALSSSGCATLASNVEGNFSCRAPNGSCAPTSIIDAAATGVELTVGGQVTRTNMQRSESGKGLRIVLAPYRDDLGREHEARVVHVVLPEPAGENWRTPLRTGEILRSIAHAIVQRGDADTANQTQPPGNSEMNMPDLLFSPSQHGSAPPGANALEPGAPGRNASPGGVPHPSLEEGESQ